MPNRMKSASYSVPLKFKPCHCGGLHLKLPALNIFASSTRLWPNRELSELAGIPDSQHDDVQIRASCIYSPAKAERSHLPPSCLPFARQQESLVNLSLASGLTHLADTHQTGALTPTHTLTAGKTTFLTISSEDTGESKTEYKADADHNWIPPDDIISQPVAFICWWCSGVLLLSLLFPVDP